MSAPELKPCPFCGAKGHIHKNPDPDHGDFYCVKCSKCRAKSPEFHASETCPIFFGQVRDAWNTRAEAAENALALCEDQRREWEHHCKTAEAERDALKADLEFMKDNRNKWMDAAQSARAERDALKAKLTDAVDTANQAIDVIASVQHYKQPDDPTEENALTMCEHEVFDFDVETARAALRDLAGGE
jgi:hypothetical protein